MCYQAPKRWILPIAILFALVASIFSVSQSYARGWHSDTIPWTSEKKIIVQPSDTGCLPSACGMVLDDLQPGLPMNLENTILGFTQPGIEGRITHPDLPDVPPRKGWGSNFRGGSEILHNQGTKTHLYRKSDITPNTLKRLAAEGNPPVIVGVKTATGKHAIIVDGIVDIGGTEYYIVRDPGQGANAKYGGSYLKPKATMDQNVLGIIEPLPPGVEPAPHLDPQRKAAGGKFTGEQPAKRAPPDDPDSPKRKATTAGDDAAKAGDKLGDAARTGDKVGDTAKTVDKLGDAAKTGDKLSDVAKANRMSKSLSALSRVMEAVGKVGAAADVTMAAGQFKSYLDTMRKAWDPATPDEESDKLFEKALKMAQELTKSSVLVAVMEKYPPVAAAFGAWTLTCLAGEWRARDVDTGEIISRRPASGDDCSSRHVKAHERLTDYLTGKSTDIAAYRQKKCDAFIRDYKNKRVRKNKNFSVLDICNFIKSGVEIDDIVEYVPRPSKKTAEGGKKTTGTECGPAKVVKPVPDKDGFIPQTYDPEDGINPDCPPIGEAGKGDDGLTGEGKKDVAKANNCALAEGQYQKARAAYVAGDADAYKAGLTQAGEAMAKAPGDSCDGLAEKIAKGHQQAEILKKVNTSAGKLLSTCKGADPRTRATQMRELSGLLSRTKQPYVQQLRRRLDAARKVASAYADTKDAFKMADLNAAGRHLWDAREALGRVDAGDCPDLRAAVAKAPRVLENWREGIRKIATATQNCSIDAMERHRAKLKGMSSPIAESLIARLNMALPECKQQKREQNVARKREEHEEKPKYTCKAGYNPGPEAADGKVYCVPTKATADAWCEANNTGSGYYATNIKPNGSYGCLPTRANASAWCRENYTAAGLHFAGKIKSDGTYNCVASKKTASAACRAANPGMRGIYARMKKNGLYDCKQTRKAATASRRRGTQPRRPQPGLSAQDVARGAAIIGGIINQMQRGGGGRRSGGGGDCRRQVGDMYSNRC